MTYVKITVSIDVSRIRGTVILHKRLALFLGRRNRPDRCAVFIQGDLAAAGDIGQRGANVNRNGNDGRRRTIVAIGRGRNVQIQTPFTHGNDSDVLGPRLFGIARRVGYAEQLILGELHGGRVVDAVVELQRF